MFTYFIVEHSHALICPLISTYVCIFHTLFYNLKMISAQGDQNVVFFVASFYSELCFKKTTYNVMYAAKPSGHYIIADRSESS